MYSAGPYRKKTSWGFISESLAYCKQGSLRCRATRYCHGRGSSLRTAGMAGGCVGKTQTATGRCPIPGLQTGEKGRVWAGGSILSPQLAEIVRTGFWTASTCWSERKKNTVTLEVTPYLQQFQGFFYNDMSVKRKHDKLTFFFFKSYLTINVVVISKH